MKVCNKCGTKKPLTEFYNHATNADGKDGRCKVCHRNISLKWRKENIKHCTERQRQYRADVRAKRRYITRSHERKGTVTHASNLTTHDVDLIRELREEHKMKLVDIAEKFEVSTSTVSSICRYQSRVYG